MEKLKELLMDYGVLAGLPLLLIVLGMQDRKKAEKNAKRTAKARRTRNASTTKSKTKKRTTGRKTTKKRKKGPVSKKEFLKRMRLGRLKAARLRKKK